MIATVRCATIVDCAHAPHASAHVDEEPEPSTLRLSDEWLLLEGLPLATVLALAAREVTS